MTAPNLFRLPPATKAYIRDLEARASADAQSIAERDAQIAELIRRVEILEEQYRLALAQRFAPQDGKRGDAGTSAERIRPLAMPKRLSPIRGARRFSLFGEAEQIAEIEPADEDDDLPGL